MALAFPKSIVLAAFERSGGRCECKCLHNHDQKCQKTLTWNRRGFNGTGGLEANPISNKGKISLDNCEILCMSCLRVIKRLKRKLNCLN